MFLGIDPRSGVPIYRQIMDGVRYSVATGTLRGGDRLPSVRELAVTLSVNPTTIQKAYGELEHLGVIETRRGRGTFVTENPPPVDEGERGRAIEAELRALLTRAAELAIGREELTRLFTEALARFHEKTKE